MKNKNIKVYRLNVRFLRYIEMNDYLNKIYNDSPNMLIDCLVHDIYILKRVKSDLENCLANCNKQISFVEDFLVACGVNVYVKKDSNNN